MTALIVGLSMFNLGFLCGGWLMHALLLTAWLACQSLDAGTTYYALHSGRFHEGNPLMRGPQLYALKVTLNLGGVAIYKTLPAAHTVVPLAFAATGCLGGSLNLRTIAHAR